MNRLANKSMTSTVRSPVQRIDDQLRLVWTRYRTYLRTGVVTDGRSPVELLRRIDTLLDQRLEHMDARR